MEQACYICPSVTRCVLHKILITIMFYDTFTIIQFQNYRVLLRVEIMKLGVQNEV
jgi:hypothetical protein